MTPPSPLEIRPVHAPASVDSDGAEDYLRTIEVRNRVYREVSGHDDNAAEPGELLPFYQENPHETRLLWLVLDEGRAVGRVGLNLPREAGSRTAYMLIELIRDAWGRGIGTAAHAVVEAAAREAGRGVLQTWVEHPAAEGEQLAPPTGFGAVPKDHAARFLLRHGYTLEQVVRMSSYDLHAPREELVAHAEHARAAASGYRVVQWDLPTPEEHVPGYAWMKSRMSTDAPSAGLETDEEVWDAERLHDHDARYVSGGRRVRVTAAQHIESGQLCAFNELSIGADTTLATQQEDTLVLREHRGHRLGMLVKAEALLRWRELFPDSPRVITYNAEENRPMLDINEALGFEPRTYEGAWKKVLR